MNELMQNVPDEKKAEIQHKIASWINELLYLTKKSDRTIEDRWIITLTNALMEEFQSWYFCKLSRVYIAKKYEFFPSFKEICDSLKEWVEIERNRRNSVNIDQNEYKNIRFQQLSSEEQAFVKIFNTNKANQWRYTKTNGVGKEEKYPPPLSVQIKRENESKKFLHDRFYKAWAYLFPKEAEEEQKSRDYSQSYTEENVRKWIIEIHNEPHNKFNEGRLNFIAYGIQRYKPDLMPFFEKLKAEILEKAA